jgi:hypothetical protein
MVTIQGSENTVVTLLDMVGHVVSETAMENTTLKMDVSELNSGIYFIALTDQNGQRITRKLVVR